MSAGENRRFSHLKEKSFDFRIEGIKIPAVKIFLDNAQAFSESLEMYNFPLPQKPDWVTDFRIFYQTEDIIICGSCFLFRGKIFCQICDRITF